MFFNCLILYRYEGVIGLVPRNAGSLPNVAEITIKRTQTIDDKLVKSFGNWILSKKKLIDIKPS